MGCVISCGFKFVLQIINVTLCLVFAAVGIFGILLKTSKNVVHELLTKLFDKFDAGDPQIKELAKFMIDNADGLAIILIVVGFALAAICLFGAISVCCGLGILLKIYAVILIVLLIAEIIAVAYLFSDPKRIPATFIRALQEAEKYYGEGTPKGQTSTAVWNVMMTFDGFCCGIDDYKEFPDQNKLPLPCCNQPPDVTDFTCNKTVVVSSNVPGCRTKIENFVNDNAKMILYVSIAAIGLQALLIVIVFLTICL